MCISRKVSGLIRDEVPAQALFLNYQRPGGSDHEREVAAQMAAPAHVPRARADRLIVYPGNQAILFSTLLSLTSPGDVVLTEALTFPGTKAAAEKLKLRLVGVAMDADGVRPDALKAACKTYKPKAVYLIPTLHNPTTATLPPKRREAIADIIRASKTILIEDDAYGWLEPTVSPIANLIPERTYLAVGLSKCIAPALRVSYLLVPDAAAGEAMRNALAATVQMPPPLMVRSGDPLDRSRDCRQDRRGHPQRSGRPPAARRQVFERRAVRRRSARSSSVAAAAAALECCTWRFLSEVLHRGLAVVADNAFAVGGASLPAVRVSLGAARTRAELAQGLQSLAETLTSPVQNVQVV